MSRHQVSINNSQTKALDKSSSVSSPELVKTPLTWAEVHLKLHKDSEKAQQARMDYANEEAERFYDYQEA